MRGPILTHVPENVGDGRQELEPQNGLKIPQEAVPGVFDGPVGADLTLDLAQHAGEHRKFHPNSFFFPGAFEIPNIPTGSGPNGAGGREMDVPKSAGPGHGEQHVLGRPACEVELRPGLHFHRR